jgi:hypothetical protein
MGGLVYQENDPNVKVKKPKSDAVKPVTPGGTGTGPGQNVTKLEAVDPANYVPPKGSIVGNDVESAYWGLFNKAGAPREGDNLPKEDLSLSLSDRSNQFGAFQDQTTKFTSDLMTNAGNTANDMFGQGVYNQMTGDNDQVVQADIQALQEQFGGNVNHPAFIKAKNDMLQTAKMFNARAYTDLKQKAGQYGLQVADMARNYYDSYSTREEEQQKLRLATDQYNAEMKLKQSRAAGAAGRGAASEAFGQQMAALAAISANRKFEASMGLEASTTELQARSADKVSMLNLQLENKKLDVAMATAKKQQSSSIIGSVFKGLVGLIPVVGDVLKNANVGF